MRLTSRFLGLAETRASSGKSPITITPVRSYRNITNQSCLYSFERLFKHLISTLGWEASPIIIIVALHISRRIRPQATIMDKSLGTVYFTLRYFVPVLTNYPTFFNKIPPAPQTMLNPHGQSVAFISTVWGGRVKNFNLVEDNCNCHVAIVIVASVPRTFDHDCSLISYLNSVKVWQVFCKLLLVVTKEKFILETNHHILKRQVEIFILFNSLIIIMTFIK